MGARTDRGFKMAKGAFSTLAALLLVLGLAGSSTAQGVASKGMIVGKDSTQMQLTLRNGVVVQVTDLTRISDEHRKRIAFADLKVAPLVAGATMLMGEAMIRYTGRTSGGLVVARRIEVLGTFPR